jgi:NAD(P)H-nitrite reductase large subunit
MKDKQSERLLVGDFERDYFLSTEDQNDQLICECFCVSFKDVFDHFKDPTDLTLEKILVEFPIGTGCGSCLKNSTWVNRIIK